MSADIDCVIVGAGVVGLAIARALAISGRDVLIVDQAEGIGTATSSRNSEVIHAGLYYPTGSLKARHCVEGRQWLYAYCRERGIAHQQTGKLIVATNDTEAAQLQHIQAQAHDNGVTDLYRIDAAQARALEPELMCHSALVSPSTGIIDSHALMLSLLGDAENHGAHCVFHTRLVAGQVRDNTTLELEFDGDTSTRLTAGTVVNATGLHAPDVARRFSSMPPALIPAAYYCKGSYFSYMGTSPFQHLIYPMPDDTGLGVHLTLDLAGQARFGPDTEWVDTINYDFDNHRRHAFYNAIRRYWPSLPDNSLAPGYTGIRPKIVGPGHPAADFIIQGPAEHGINGLVHLFGIESPGLTACLSLAHHVGIMLGAHEPDGHLPFLTSRNHE